MGDFFLLLFEIDEYCAAKGVLMKIFILVLSVLVSANVFADYRCQFANTTVNVLLGKIPACKDGRYSLPITAPNLEEAISTCRELYLKQEMLSYFCQVQDELKNTLFDNEIEVRRLEAERRELLCLYFPEFC